MSVSALSKGLPEMISRGLLQPKLFYDSMLCLFTSGVFLDMLKNSFLPTPNPPNIAYLRENSPNLHQGAEENYKS